MINESQVVTKEIVKECTTQIERLVALSGIFTVNNRRRSLHFSLVGEIASRPITEHFSRKSQSWANGALKVSGQILSLKTSNN